jgi:Arc/MetJ-type ribon-helix-helix transcriptional regulator
VSYLIEPDLPEDVIQWIDQQVAAGRFNSRADAILCLLKAGLDTPDPLQPDDKT